MKSFLRQRNCSSTPPSILVDLINPQKKSCFGIFMRARTSFKLTCFTIFTRSKCRNKIQNAKSAYLVLSIIQ